MRKERLTTVTRLCASSIMLALGACSGGDGPAPAVKIDSLFAVPMMVASGGTTTLAWQTSNATGVTISATPGGDLVTDGVGSGTMESAPLTEDTRFTIRANGPGGPATRTVDVTVTGTNDMPMITTFSAMPFTIAPGDMSALSWATVNADSVSIAAGGTTIVDAGQPAGTTGVTPVDSTEYTLIATGAGGTAMATVMVTVTLDPIINAFTATPNVVDRGDTVTVTWDVTNANNITVRDNENNELYNDTGLTGSVMVMPTVDATYTLIATNANGTTMETASVTVNPVSGPSILRFEGSPTSVNLGELVTLSWEVQNATTITIDDGAGTSTMTTELMGMRGFRPLADRTYTLTASDGVNPEVTATVTVSVIPAAPAIVSLVATPNPGGIGQTTDVTFEVIGADTVTVSRGATQVYSGTLGMDSFTSMPLTEASTTYTLVATNAIGTNMAMLVVEAHNAPTINAFTVTPRTFVGTAMATIAWDVSSTVRLELFVDGMLDPMFTGVGTGTSAVDASGTYPIALSGSTELRLVARSSGGVVEATIRALQLVSEIEPNDDFAAAQPFPIGGGIQAAITSVDDVDWYVFSVPDDYSVRAETSDGAGGCALDTLMAVTTTSSGDLAFNDDKSPQDLCSLIDPATRSAVRGLRAGTYYVGVGAVQPNVGSYVLDVQLLPPRCGNGYVDGADQCDDGNTVLGDGCDAMCRFEIGAGYSAPGAPVTLTASIAAGSFITYEITATTETYIRANTFSNAASGSCTIDTRLALADSTGTPLVGNVNGGPSTCSSLEPTITASLRVQAGTYYLNVYSDPSAPNYVQTVLEGIAVDICGNGLLDGTNEHCDDGNIVAGDGCSATCQLEPVATFVATAGAAQTFTGHSLAVGQVNAYAITVPAGNDVYLLAETFGDAAAMTCSIIDTFVTVLDASASPIGADDDGGVERCSVILPGDDQFARLSGGTSYFVTVEDWERNEAIASYDIVFAAFTTDICGNGIVDTGESCDDGNTVGADACPANCILSNSLTGVATTGITIPDNDLTGITDTISLPATPACTTHALAVDIDITHTFRGDLIVELTSPNGTTVRLWNGTGGSAADLVGTFPTTLVPANPFTPFMTGPGNGNWTLRVADRASQDFGALNAWGLSVGCL